MIVKPLLVLCVFLVIFSFVAPTVNAQPEGPCYWMGCNALPHTIISDPLSSGLLKVYDTVTIPTWMNSSDVSTAISDAAEAWTVGTTIVRGTTSSTTDATTQIIFVESKSEWEGYGLNIFVPAQVDPITGAQRNIYINCVDSLGFGSGAWDTGATCDSDPNTYHLTSVLVHELGHVLGLVHSYVCTWSVMSVITANPCQTEITPFDQNAILCAYPNEPESDIAGYFVSNGAAHWNVLSENNTHAYGIEGCNSPNEPGILLATSPAGVGSHVLDLPNHNYPFLRLVEVDDFGVHWPKGVTSKQSVVGKQSVPLDLTVSDAEKPTPPVKIDRPLQGGIGSVSSSKYGIETASATSPDYVIYTSTALQSTVSSTVAQYWSSRGHIVEIVTGIESLPSGDRRPEIKNDITAKVAAHGTFFFHVVGDWLNSEYWAVTDQDLGDVNDDGVPDVIVTRWPASDAVDVMNASQKMEWYNDHLHYGPFKAAFFTGDIDFYAPVGTYNSGEFARNLSADLEARLLQIAGDRTIVRLYESDYPDDYTRASLAASRLNTYRPELIQLLGTASTKLDPAHFFTVYADGNPDPWHMGMLNSNTIIPMIVAASCETTKPSSSYVAGKFMFDYGNRGAVSWVGTPEGTAQYGDYAVSYYLIEELYQHPCRSMAKSWLIAMQRAQAAFPNPSDYKNTIGSFQFFGDPFTPFKTKDGPLYVDINGPEQLNPQQQGTFQAVASGGLPPYSYTWYKSQNCTGYYGWSQIGTGQYATAASRESFCLKVVVSTLCGSAESYHSVYVPGDEPIPKFQLVDEAPISYDLKQNHPNPFNPVTNLAFDLPQASHVSLIVYDVKGGVVARLLDRQMERGRHTIPFDGTGLASGIYFYKLVAGEFTATRRMVLLK